MKLILFATDTCKEAIIFMEELGNMLYEKQISFEYNKYSMKIKTEYGIVVFVAQTSKYMVLYQYHPFDYYIFTGDAKYDWTVWRNWCLRRTKSGAKEIIEKDELFKLLTEE